MRIITRPDFDGITCCILLSVMEKIDSILFIEPSQLFRDSLVVTSNDIIANLPFHKDCGLWFDHHISNTPPVDTIYSGLFSIDPSAARTIYKYYNNTKLDSYLELLSATDKVDSANLTLDEVRFPKDYILLSLTIDPRSNFSNTDEYYHLLISLLKKEPIETVMNNPEVKLRCDRILKEQSLFESVLNQTSVKNRNVVFTDLRNVPVIPVGSRFLIYTLFTDCNSSVKVFRISKPENYVCISIAHSIFNKTQKANVGEICASYGGGGHFGAGSFVVPEEKADQVISEIIPILHNYK